MNILVTGHTGFVGNRMVGRLQEDGHTVVGLERDFRKNKGMYNPDFVVKGDVREPNIVRRLVADYEIEEIYHFAAQAIVKVCAEDPMTTYDVNVMGTVSLLEAVRTAGSQVKSVVVSSSDKSFGHAPVPYTEKTPMEPLYTYEASKTCQHIVTMNYFHNYNVPAKVVACSNIYGPSDPNRSRIIPNTIMRLAHGEPAMINDGVKDFVREYVYVDDVVDAFIKVSREGAPGELYCCGGTDVMSVEELIRKICVIMGKDYDSNVMMFKKASIFKEIMVQYIDASKLRGLGWTPKMSFDDGIKACVDYYSKC